jgi:hypothetical protein
MSLFFNNEEDNKEVIGEPLLLPFELADEAIGELRCLSGLPQHRPSSGASTISNQKELDLVSVLGMVFGEGPLKINYYADFSKVKLKKSKHITSFAQISNTTTEMDPSKWHIDELHPLYSTLLQKIITALRDRKNGTEVCFLVSLTMNFHNMKHDKHVSTLTLHVNNRIVTARYEDGAFGTKQRLEQFSSCYDCKCKRVTEELPPTVNDKVHGDARDHPPPEDGLTRYYAQDKMHYRLYTAMFATLKALNVDMQHDQRVTMQPYGISYCASSLLCNLVLRVHDSLLAKILTQLHSHHQFKKLYKNPKSSSGEDRTAQLLWVALFEEHISRKLNAGDVKANIQKYCDESEVYYNSMDNGICRICNQADHPVEMSLCENEKCPVAEHHSCGGILSSSSAQQKWYCSEVCKGSPKKKQGEKRKR